MKRGDIVSTDNGDFTIITINVDYKENTFQKYGAVFNNDLQVVEDTIEEVVVEILEDVGERRFEIIRK